MKIRGSHLGSHLQKQVLAKFVHRYTKDHKPAWATWEPVQFASDKDWLEHTFFEVTKHGELSRRNTYCESSPTWPDNPELRKGGAK